MNNDLIKNINMNYSVGNIAHLISHQNTPIKIIEEKVITPTPYFMSTFHSDSNEIKDKSKIKIKKITDSSCELRDLLPKKKKPKTANREILVNPEKRNSGGKLYNAEKRIKAKKCKENVMAKLNHDMCKDRTIFVGNVAIGTTKTELRKRFSVYGCIESIRFRSVPVPDEKTSKKLAVIQKKFHKNRSSLHSYIKYASVKDSQKALVENGKVYDAHHIRVSHCNDDNSSTRDESKAVFIGNISFNSEEEDLWTTFASCGSIESVRMVRDRHTSIGKGFGYVNFTSSDAVQMALQLDNNVTLHNRQLRITICDINHSKGHKQKAQKRKQLQSSKSTKMPDKKLKTDSNFQGIKFTDLKKKKKIDKGIIQKMKIAKLFTPK